MTTDLITRPSSDTLVQAGQAANQAAARYVFQDYRARKAANTITRQDGDLARFADFLTAAGLTPGDLANNPEAWRGITWGLVEGFARWQLGQGFAVSSVNVRLSTVKTYAKLALKAGTLDTAEYAMIRAVEGYSRKEGKRINGQREEAELPTRKGSKKAAAVVLTTEQAAALKAQPETPQGRRDALLMALLLDHGLRCGEVAGLTVTDFDLKAGKLTFYRPKVDKTQTHKLTADTLRAARAYFEQDAPAIGGLWRMSASKQQGKAAAGTLTGPGMSERAITKRVCHLGRAVGVEGLSAHDCRHYWATQAARNGTPIDRLMDAGGWSSPAMPLRYVEAAAVANQGVKLE
ncbi:MAG TPA: tyrosine-type recombinase/integrase [Anaerolineales bacterium]|nr:tyrosine-type recombinase/integrase [Anaerolineales bacterium]